jgi:pyruvate dehydrogenase E2 component (dihydrolipoamide acetyltransferase)
MAEAITMPKLGFDMREGVLIRWVKNEGEAINKGDILAEIETDKATVEVESHAAGIVRKVFGGQGDSIPVGATMAIVGTPDENIDSLVPAGGAKPAPAAAAPTAATPTPAPEAAPATAPVAAAAAAPAPIVNTGPIKASPLAKKVAADKNVNLATVQGTGPGGRIVRKDVDAAIAGGGATAPQAAAAIPSPVYGLPSAPRADEVIPMTKLRQAIGRRLVESKQNLPHFYVTREYKMDALLELRKQTNAYLPEGEKLSVNDFMLKAVALTLRQFPNLNAKLDGTNIIRRGAINVGVAVTIDGGLMTVVCKDTDLKPLRVISAEVKAMAQRARDGKVKPEDVDGSTFSTSNMGMYDVENFAAIINPPEVGILAIASAREVPVVENGQVKVASRMKATISVDHRVSDGAEAAKFMQALGTFIEEPLRLML